LSLFAVNELFFSLCVAVAVVLILYLIIILTTEIFMG